MSKPVLRVENLSKCYQIGQQRKNLSFRDAVAGALAAPLRWTRDRLARAPRYLPGGLNGSSQEFWALQDVNFNVNRGEIVAVIGRNGAGKSTLLKILSRITEPTTGQAILRGRVASLLEVGTGFHAELTGRENVFLNGSILGMTKAEINRKFDEIVDFSEVGKFLDTPVKYYSSGMYVRLAFAVAAHLDPEILIVDEVLAVGDVQFQKKCMGKMQEVSSGQGRTVLFVSHNMTAVQRLCPRAILLRKGSVAADGPVNDVVQEYLSYLHQTADSAFEHNPERSGTGLVRLTSARVLNPQGTPTKGLVAGEPATFEFHYRNPGKVARGYLALTVYNHLGDAATQLDTWLYDNDPVTLGPEGVFTCHVPRIPFPPGEYRLATQINPEFGSPTDILPNALVFTIENSVYYPTLNSPSIHFCSAMIDHEWQHTAARFNAADLPISAGV